jgi:hypothetical protein
VGKLEKDRAGKKIADYVYVGERIGLNSKSG